MRAGLAFVLVSLLAGTLVRDWQRDHRVRFEDLVADLEQGDADDRRHAAAGVPSEGPRPFAADSGAAEAARTRRASALALRPRGIDMERAQASDWERLPGIGPALAARIVADRAERGPFGTLEGLLRVRGIGPRTLDRIRPYLAPAPDDSGSPIAN